MENSKWGTIATSRTFGNDPAIHIIVDGTVVAYPPHPDFDPILIGAFLSFRPAILEVYPRTMFLSICISIPEGDKLAMPVLHAVLIENILNKGITHTFICAELAIGSCVGQEEAKEGNCTDHLSNLAT
jgi:hypothetical protein